MNANDFLKWCAQKERLDYHRQAMGETVESYDLIKGTVKYRKKPKEMVIYRQNFISNPNSVPPKFPSM